jgi:hypothetical protein
VFTFSRRSIAPRGHLHAAILTAGPKAFLSHRTAAAVYGLRKINRYEIHISVPSGGRQNRKNLRIHRIANLDQRAVRVYDGLRVSSFARMLIELSAEETPAELDRLVTEGARRDLLQIDRLNEAIERSAGCRGLAKLRTTLGDYVHTPRDKSTLERDFATFLARDPRIPPPQRNVILEHTYEIDFLWPEHRLALELDGRPYHQAVRDRERDNAQDIWLQKRSLNVIRIRDFRFEHDRNGIRADLHHFLVLADTA